MEDYSNDPTLADPDASPDVKYHWDKEFQRHIAALLISDRQFLLQSIDLVRPSYFTEKAHAKVCEIAFFFFKKYRILPRKDFIVQEIKTQLKNDKTLPYYLGEVNVLFDYFQPGMESREYLQDKIVYFAKIQTLRRSFHESLALIEKEPESEDTWSKIYDKMRDAMSVSQNLDLGVDYFQSYRDRYLNREIDTDPNAKFITGWNDVDIEVSGGGYSRGEIISIVAGSGVGKSLALANFAITNLARGKKVVYISLELSEVKIADRFDAIVTGFPVQNLYAHKENIFIKLDEIAGKTKDGDIWPLIIKQFPAGTATVNVIRAYISQLRFHGFNPDFIIIDYVGEMALHPDLKPHESRERIVRELRAMATEEDVFVATAMQPNRDAKRDNKGEQGRIDDEHLADSFGQIRPLDGCMSLNQNDTEKLLGIARGFVIKQRDGKSRYWFYLRINKENLRMTQITRDEYKCLLSAVKEYAAEDVDADLVKGYEAGAESVKIDAIKNTAKNNLSFMKDENATGE